MNSSLLSSALILLLLLEATSSFSVLLPSSRHATTKAARTAQLFSSATDDDITSMRLREIQTELKERGVSYTDCFDRESLTVRLKEAREGNASVAAPATAPADVVSDPEPAPTAASNNKEPFDRDATLAELRAMRVPELRGELGKRNIRWANMLEKEDLVKALLSAREAASSFSANLTPGQVGALTDEQLEQELNESTSSTPLLLDVYATWCGPCKLMAPELVKAAAEFGDTVRVAKIDSDEYPDWSRKLGVQAFPTVLVFDGDGKEVQRVEGALMENQLVNLVQPYL